MSTQGRPTTCSRDEQIVKLLQGSAHLLTKYVSIGFDRVLKTDWVTPLKMKMMEIGIPDLYSAGEEFPDSSFALDIGYPLYAFRMFFYSHVALNGSLVSIEWCVFRFRMNETVSRYLK
jgi:hypothetical protein